jgi:membrane protease subunit HflK
VHLRPMEDSSTRAFRCFSSSFKIIKVLMVGLVVIFLGSGIFTVEPNEVAVVLRFGKPLGSGPDQVLQQGLHWSFPSPIDEIVTVPIGETRSVSATNCWYAMTPEMEVSGQLPFALLRLQPGVDGYALTSDGNIIHARATAQYLIQDPVSFEFKLHSGRRFARKCIEQCTSFCFSSV